MTPENRTSRRGAGLLLAAVVVLVVVLGGLFVWSPWSSKQSSKQGASSSGDGSSASGPVTAPSAPAIPAGELIRCPAITKPVRTAGELTSALAAAAPGDVIGLADGVYSGAFTVSNSGTAARPIWLCGGPGAVLDGGSTSGGYVLHLKGVSNLRVLGFTLRNGQKGLMADATTKTVVQGLTVTDIGDEGIHLRSFSTGNTVIGNRVAGTGRRKSKFGEGIYVGTAQSNWCDISGCRPDASDGNTIAWNAIADTTAENVDIKEGTTAGTLKGNHFDGAGSTAAESWVNVKGRGWMVEANTGVHAPQDAFSTHVITDGAGDDNTFRGNVVLGSLSGYGFNLTKPLGNVVECDNRAPGASKGLSNVSCSARGAASS